MPIRTFMLALLSANALLHAQDRLPRPFSHQNRAPEFVPPSANQAAPQNSAAPTAVALPVTPPTATAPADTQSPERVAPPPAQGPARRATVSTVNGLISVSASNASLNQILRDISRSTGIKITGGVADERVFGEYGPAPASQVLGSLLDGTGSNMLLISGLDGRPSELVLTTRTGGPTPPNPNSASFDSNGDSDDAVRQFVSPPPPNSQSQPSQPATAGPIPPQNPDGSTAPAPASGDATQQSPNGVKTPQQIYDELMRMRRQQQQPPQ